MKLYASEWLTRNNGVWESGDGRNGLRVCADGLAAHLDIPAAAECLRLHVYTTPGRHRLRVVRYPGWWPRVGGESSMLYAAALNRLRMLSNRARRLTGSRVVYVEVEYSEAVETP